MVQLPVSILWVLVMAGFLAWEGCLPRKKVEETPPVSHSHSPGGEVKADPIQPPAAQDNAREQSIAKGIAFLKKARWEFDLVYLYSYIQPRFNWPDLPAQKDHGRIVDSLKSKNDDNAQRILGELTLFERLRKPGFVLPKVEMEKAREVDKLTIPALYCDYYRPDTAAYFPVVRQAAHAGAYELTHALLACIWMEERQCMPPHALEALRRPIVKRNREMVELIPMWLDLNIEAAALLQAAGEDIPQSWIEAVINAQQPDGGWLHGPGYTVSSTHTTTLALWLLAGTD